MAIMVDAARRLIAEKGARFTTQELVKEAGVAMQTFYRHFAGKDHLLIAVIEDMISEQVVRYEEAARDLPDPVARLRQHVMAALSGLGDERRGLGGPRFVTGEHWRLYQLYPEEMTYATRPYTALIAREIRAARQAGLLDVADVDRAAAYVELLVRSVYHHYAFAEKKEPAEVIGEQVWAFCLTGLGGQAERPGEPRKATS